MSRKRPYRSRSAEFEPGHACDEYPDCDGEPMHGRSYPLGGQFILRERAVHSLAWPLDATEDHEFEARRNLEQVGRILHRLELDQADIVLLRTETRAILAGLAA